MDQLITIVVVLIVSAFATLLKKKAQAKEEANHPPEDQSGQSRRAPAPQPQRRAAPSWEEELRRLLEGEAPAAPPPMRPPPPPVVTAPYQRTAPAPVNLPPRRALEPRVAPIPVPSSVEISAGQMAPLDQSRTAYERASQLDTAMSAHINRVAGEHVQLTTVVRKPLSGEAAQVISLFKTARTARQAVLASIILGPPMALEQAPTLF